MSRTTAIIVMGVSGSGKTTVGQRLAHRLNVPFVDADDLHPRANVVKMSAGIPLTDGDRWPWLDLVAAEFAPGGGNTGAKVVACSALRRRYRDHLRASVEGLFFVHLDGAKETISARMDRPGHFMPAGLLDSQLATLEPLHADERGVTLDARWAVDELVGAAVRSVNRLPATNAETTVSLSDTTTSGRRAVR